MSGQTNSNKGQSPDELFMLIRKQKELFCGRKEKISQTYSRLISNKTSKHVPRNTVNIVTVPERKNNASAQNKYMKSIFHLFYERLELYSGSVSQEFADQLNVLQNSAGIVFEQFNRIFASGFDLVKADENSLDLLVLAMKSIIIKMDQLVQEDMQRQQLEHELEQQQLQQEQQKLEEQKQLEQEQQVLEIEDSQLLSNIQLSKQNQGETSQISDGYRNNIQKAVNNLCSQITSGNESHALGRLRELIELLDGGQIALVGTENRERLNLRGHPGAPALCWSLLRDAVITQAETQFSDNLETTMAFASLLSALLGRFPAEMPALLDAVHARYQQALLPSDHCQCTTNIQSGCRNHGDEHQEMTGGQEQSPPPPQLRGLARLIGAVLVARTPRGFPGHAQLSVRQLWVMLATLAAPASTQTQARCPDKAAEACLALLEVGAPALLASYGNQALKLVAALQRWFQQHRCTTYGGLSQRAVLLELARIQQQRALQPDC